MDLFEQLLRPQSPALPRPFVITSLGLHKHLLSLEISERARGVVLDFACFSSFINDGGMKCDLMVRTW